MPEGILAVSYAAIDAFDLYMNSLRLSNDDCLSSIRSAQSEMGRLHYNETSASSELGNASEKQAEIYETMNQFSNNLKEHGETVREMDKRHKGLLSVVNLHYVEVHLPNGDAARPLKPASTFMEGLATLGVTPDSIVGKIVFGKPPQIQP